jgi:hypothetical protein
MATAKITYHSVWRDVGQAGQKSYDIQYGQGVSVSRCRRDKVWRRKEGQRQGEGLSVLVPRVGDL